MTMCVLGLRLTGVQYLMTLKNNYGPLHFTHVITTTASRSELGPRLKIVKLHLCLNSISLIIPSYII